MARASGLSVTTVHRIWQAFSLRLHQSKTFKLSTDPLFIEKGARHRRPLSQPADSCAGAFPHRSITRQVETPSTAGSGPASTNARNAV